jgi:tRNA(fMet)-specific endonuclease VapC
MSEFLLDTNHASLLMNPQDVLWQKIKGGQGQRFGVALIVCAELWYMVFNSQRQIENTSRLERLLQDLTIYDFTPHAAKEYGRLKADLRRKGRPVPQNDLQIASVAIVHRCTLLTADAHFADMPDLRTENWRA